MSAHCTRFMVDFELSEEQDMLVGLAKNFADDELIPNAEEWDRNGIFPSSNHKLEISVYECTIPEQYGGLV